MSENDQPPPPEDDPWPDQGPNIRPNKSPEERMEALTRGDADTEELPEKHKTEQPIVVGIGASAGGLEAMIAFFEALPPDTGLTFVVVTHLAPDHPSLLDELLQRHTTMPTRQVSTTRVRIEPNHVYVVPPNRQLVLTDAHLHASEFEGPRAGRAPIDIFFRSLAAVHGNPVAIVMSGGGSDGALGIRSVKEAGGLVMVQAPDEAAHDSMPNSAIATGVVDLVLPARALAQKLVEINRRRVHVPADPTQLTPEQHDILQRILTQLNTRTGYDFRAYKQTTVLRRIQRRMQITGYETLEGYLFALRQNDDEAQALLDDLLIGVTNFFRDEESWLRIANDVIPQLFAGKGRDDVVRVWSIGCSTGEEAYTLAILLMEHAATLDHAPSIQVFATDLDEGSLIKARDGLYPDTIAADVSIERLQRFFTKEGSAYRVRREVRDNVLFATHSVLRDPPFSRQSLLVCRNLLIYLQRPLQENLFEIFYYALVPGGFLFLGNSETADSAGEMFTTFDKKHRIYQTREWSGQHRPLPALPLVVRSRRPVLPMRSGAPRPPTIDGGTRTMYERTLEEYGPPTALVDDEFNVVRLSGAAGRYLSYPDGPPTNNLTRLVREELQFELRSGLFQAFEKGISTVSAAIAVPHDGQERRVYVSVWPRHAAGEQRLALVVFMEDQGFVPRVASAGGDDEDDKSVVQQLEAEVRHLRERLQATVEEHETSHEELKAANEELQSINEEYRSTTEELETSKEELQSVNEELETVNNELKGKLEEISRAHSDLQNLLTATEIATLFLDRDLRIQRYTAGIEDIFNIMRGDRGRPIAHLTHQLDYPELGEDAGQVLRALVPIEREVARIGADAGDNWYLVRLRPYRTIDDRIEGVVITFIDITELRQAENDTRQARERLDLALGVAGMGWGTWDLATGWIEADARARRLLGFAPGQPVTVDAWLERIHPDDRDLVRAMTRADHAAGERVDLEYRILLPGGEVRHVNSAYAVDVGAAGAQWIGLIDDVTDARTSLAVLEEARSFMDQALASAELGWGVADLETGELEQNARARALVGFSPDEPLTTALWISIIHPDDQARVAAYHEESVREGRDSNIEYRVIRRDGEVRVIHGTGTLRIRSDGHRIITGTLRDVTERRRAEAELRRLTDELEQMVAEQTEELRRTNAELTAARDRFQLLFNASPMPSVILDPADGTYVDANPAFMAFMELSREEVVGRRSADVVAREPVVDDPDALAAIFLEKGRLLSQEMSFELRPGEERTVLASFVGLELDGRPLVLSTVVDISERKRAEEHIRSLTWMLTRAEEQERQRISAILHDDLQQRLYALQIEMLRLREKLDPAILAESTPFLAKVEQLLPETINIARDLSVDLSPPILRDEGLAEAIEWLGGRMRREYGLVTKVSAKESFPLRDEGLRIVLFQVIRELLFNVVKHAGVEEAQVSLERREGDLQIEVIDGGRGFDPQEIAALARDQSSHGLSMARQRLALFGGRLETRSVPGQGTTIVIRIPLHGVEGGATEEGG
jgi:two-component system CheB/CheR fusion protein